MKNTLTFEIKNKSGEVLAKQSGQDFVHLVYENEYAEGDCIVFSVSQKKSFLVIQFDTVLNPAFVYIKEHTFVYEIPFGEKRFSYDPKTFTGNLHLLKARAARPEEIETYKNLALNDHDTHTNTACFPHAKANIETRGESVFAARNAKTTYITFGKLIKDETLDSPFPALTQIEVYGTEST